MTKETQLLIARIIRNIGALGCAFFLGAHYGEQQTSMALMHPDENGMVLKWVKP